MARALSDIRDPLEDFLDWERRQEPRYEFHDGEVHMMVGGSIAHQRIVRGLEAALSARLRGGSCETFTETIKIRVGQHVFYPDVVVVCGSIPDETDGIERPVLVAEVLLPSTAEIDRGRKLDVYRAVTTLQHYLLLSQDEARVLAYTREGERWVLEEARGRAGLLRLSHPAALEIPLEEIYARTSIPE